MSNGHARLGPSNHRWPNCPGSVREEAKYPDIAGAAAIDGTGSHLLLELCLINKVRAIEYDKTIIGTGHEDNPGGWLVDIARCERVQMCLDYVSRRVDELQLQFPEATVTVDVEGKADPGGMYGRDDWWGTVDITILAIDPVNNKCLFAETIDYKDGRGWVEAVDNTQLVSYITGRIRPFIAAGTQVEWKHNVGACRQTIVQPKTGTPVRYTDVGVNEIIMRADQMAVAAAATDDPDAPLIPDQKQGKGYCQWCKHKPNCEALAGAGIEAVKIMTTTELTGATPLFEQLQNAVNDVTNMESLQLADLADTEAAVGAIYDKIKKEVQRRLEQGLVVPGYKMAAGNSSKVWNKDEDEIAKMLKSRRLKKDQIYPSSLISPAQVLKHPDLDEKQRATIEKNFISVKAGKLTLKKVSREDNRDSAEMLFASVPKVEGPVATDQPKPVSFF